MQCLNLKNVYSEQQLVEFPKFIYGFEDLSTYLLYPLAKSKEPFFFLSSTENQNVKFIVRNIESADFEKVYSSKMDIIKSFCEFVNIEDDMEIYLMTTLITKDSYKLNWKAPILLSRNKGKAWQIILDS